MNLLALMVVVLFLGAPAGRGGPAAHGAQHVWVGEGECAPGRTVEQELAVETARGPCVPGAFRGWRGAPRWQTVRGWGRPAARAPDA